MTPTQVLGVAALLAVLLPLVLVASGVMLLRRRWRTWRVRRYMRQLHTDAYRAHRTPRG